MVVDCGVSSNGEQQLRLDEDIPEEELLCTHGTLPTWLQTADRGTAECVLAQLDYSTSMPPNLTSIVTEDTHSHGLSATHSHGANTRAERAEEQCGLNSRMQSYCRQHKGSTVCDWMASLIDPDITGILSAQLGLRSQGSKKGVRKEALHGIDKILYISHGDDENEEENGLYRQGTLAFSCLCRDRGPKRPEIE